MVLNVIVNACVRILFYPTHSSTFDHCIQGPNIQRWTEARACLNKVSQSTEKSAKKAHKSSRIYQGHKLTFARLFKFFQFSPQL